MGSCAKLREFALLVKADIFAFSGVLVDKLNLVGFALFFHQLYGFIGGKLKFFKRKPLFHDLFHLRLYFFKIVR